jgi:hypothetical protein
MELGGLNWSNYRLCEKKYYLCLKKNSLMGIPKNNLTTSKGKITPKVSLSVDKTTEEQEVVSHETVWSQLEKDFNEHYGTKMKFNY